MKGRKWLYEAKKGIPGHFNVYVCIGGNLFDGDLRGLRVCIYVRACMYAVIGVIGIW